MFSRVSLRVREKCLVCITFASYRHRGSVSQWGDGTCKLISCRLSVTLPLSPQTPISTCPYPRLPDLRTQAISFPSLGWERGMRSESREERRESPVHLHSKPIRRVSMVMFASECQSNFRCGTQEIER